MKKIIFFSAIALWLFASMGCEKELSDIDITKQKLIGTWEWFVSYGGVIGEKRPKPGEKLEIIFTENSVLVTHNMEVVDNKPVITDKKKVLLDGSYIISKEQDTLYITITSEEETEDLEPLSFKKHLYLNQTGDTLGFSYSRGTAQFADVYKKVN